MMDLFGGAPAQTTSAQPAAAATGGGDLMDLLGGLDMGGPPQQQPMANTGLNDIFGGGMPQ